MNGVGTCVITPNGQQWFSQVWFHPARRTTSLKTTTVATTILNHQLETKTQILGSTWRWRKEMKIRWQQCDANWSAGVANWAKKSTPGGGPNERETNVSRTESRSPDWKITNKMPFAKSLNPKRFMCLCICVCMICVCVFVCLCDLCTRVYVCGNYP